MDKARKITYGFIRDEGRELAGDGWQRKGSMGGIRLKDIRMMVVVTTIKRTIRIWNSNKSLWAEWMRQKYVKGRALNCISSKYSQFLKWSSIVRKYKSPPNVLPVDRVIVLYGKGPNQLVFSKHP